MKGLAAVACVAAAMFVGAGTVRGEYQQETPVLTLNPSQVALGATCTATLPVTCVDGASIDVTVEPAGDVTAAICNIDTFVARLTAPSRLGTYDVIASGPGLDVRATLTVTAALGGPEEPLPSTGPNEASSMAKIGGLLLAAGVALRTTSTVPVSAHRLTF